MKQQPQLCQGKIGGRLAWDFALESEGVFTSAISIHTFLDVCFKINLMCLLSVWLSLSSWSFNKIESCVLLCLEIVMMSRLEYNEDVNNNEIATFSEGNFFTNFMTYLCSLWRSMWGEVDNRRSRENDYTDAPRGYFRANIVNEVTKCSLNARENSRRHHTDRFEILDNETKSPLIIRRGDTFYLSMCCFCNLL